MIAAISIFYCPHQAIVNDSFQGHRPTTMITKGKIKSKDPIQSSVVSVVHDFKNQDQQHDKIEHPARTEIGKLPRVGSSR